MNTKLINALTALSLGLLANYAPVAAADDAQVEGIMQKAVDQVIKPGYQGFSDGTVKMVTAMETLCGENSEKALGNARDAFNTLVHDWSVAEVLRDGPVIRENRFERIYFFPDRKSIGLKQVQEMLAKKNEADIDVTTMHDRSVALQGIGTAEYILFGTGSEELAAGKENFRCHAGLAVAMNLEDLADELLEAWSAPDGIEDAWKKPGPDNPVYRTSEEAMSGLLGVLVRGVETIRDKRIAVFFKPEDDYGNPKKAPLWRSQNTFASIAGNLEGLQDYWLKSGMQHIIKGDESAITTNITFDFKTAIATAKSIQAPVAEVLKDEELRKKFEFLLFTLEDLQDRLNMDYGHAMGLGTSFTFSDGD